MSGPVDTSSAREVARRLRSVPFDMTVDEFDAAGDLIETLLAERDALRAEVRAARMDALTATSAAEMEWSAQLAAARREVWEAARKVAAVELEHHYRLHNGSQQIASAALAVESALRARAEKEGRA